jgi:flavin-dependent dehydrogenase
VEKERFLAFTSASRSCLARAVVRKLAARARRRDFCASTAEFVTGDGSVVRRYPFAEGIVPGPGSAFEVDRASFDAVLLDNARERGVEVREGVEVRSFEIERGGVEVVAAAEDGRSHRLQARVLVDASGQRSLVASRHGLREMDPELKNFAVFSHYTVLTRKRRPRRGHQRGAVDRAGGG